MSYKTNITLLLTAALMLLSAAPLAADSITDSYFGNKYDGFEARSFSMGAAGSFNDLRPFGIAINPANLTLMNKAFGAQGALSITRNEDNRHVPLYNSFDNYVDDAVYASNINFFDSYAGAAFGAIKLYGFKLGLGGYYKPLLSFDGKYREEIRNNRNTDNDGYPEKLATNAIENEGRLNQAAGVFSMGYDFGDFVQINLGAEFSLLNGKQNYAKTIRWSQWAKDTFNAAVNNPAKVLPEFTQTTEAELEGTQLKAGLAMRLNNRFGLAGSYTLSSTLERTGNTLKHRDAYYQKPELHETDTIDEDYILPSEIRLGFLYQPRNIMRTWLNFDVEYVRWQDVSEIYDDQLNFYVGVEHWVENRFPLRMGFSAVNGYLREVESDGAITAKRILSPKITAGSSFDLTSFLRMDLGFAYTWQEYEALDMFGDSYYNDKTYSGTNSYILWPNSHITLSDRGWENPDKVRENTISLSTGLVFTW